MKPLRFLIFSASFGAGHVKAAEALIESIKANHPTAEIIHEDPFEMINKQLNNFIRFIYIKMIKHAPNVWGGLYNMTKDFNYDSLSYRHTNNIGRDKILQYIESVNPDIIICTYPTTAGMLAQLRLDGELNIPVISVVTDYTIHNQWIHPGIDLNLVGNKEVYNGFIDKGIKESRLQISGIPVHPKFDLRPNKAKILRDFGLEEGRLTVLILGGAYGVLNKAKWILKYLGNIEANIQLMIVCGKDKKLYDSLDDIIHEARNPVVRFGYVNNIDEIMTAADVAITKAGGLIVTEALTKHLPLIIFKPIPGQEENNALFVENIGAGLISRTDHQLIETIDKIIKNPEVLQEMMSATEKAFPGHSSEKAVEAIFELRNNLPLIENSNKREQKVLEEAYV